MLATPVESSTLASIAYDYAAEVLRLEFRSHAAYIYLQVPPTVYQGLMAADSKGSYFNRYIRKRFSYLKIAN